MALPLLAMICYPSVNALTDTSNNILVKSQTIQVALRELSNISYNVSQVVQSNNILLVVNHEGSSAAQNIGANPLTIVVILLILFYCYNYSTLNL